MYHIYHTNGIVLSSINKGEANKVLTLFTKEMGLIKAMAQGVRLNKSKLRFSLQDFSYAKIDLVKGKEYWKLTSAKSVDVFPLIKKNKESTPLVFRVFKLIERLTLPEHQNENIFDDLIFFLNYINSESLKKEEIEAIEIFIVLRILNNLGYIGEQKELKKYINKEPKNSEIKDILGDKKIGIYHINKALSQSQL